jgi:hypothetical protein
LTSRHSVETALHAAVSVGYCFTEANYKRTRFGLAVGVDFPPSINPYLRPFLALMTAEKAVLIARSIQETSLSFRPRWLSNFIASSPIHRESSDRRNRHIFRGPSPIGCAGKRPLRDFANRVFRDMARKDAARSASTYGSGGAGKDKHCMKHLDRRASNTRHERRVRAKRVWGGGKIFHNIESLSSIWVARTLFSSCLHPRTRTYNPSVNRRRIRHGVEPFRRTISFEFGSHLSCFGRQYPTLDDPRAGARRSPKCRRTRPQVSFSPADDFEALESTRTSWTCGTHDRRAHPSLSTTPEAASRGRGLDCTSSGVLGRGSLSTRCAFSRRRERRSQITPM